MSTLADLLAPMTIDQFMTGYRGRTPVHVPAPPGASRRRLLDWSAFNAMLDQTGMWTDRNLRLMLNGAAVPASDYCEPAATSHAHGLRVSPRKVQVVLDQGASLVANDVQALHRPIAEAARDLSAAFAAQVEANIYCSFTGVRAFDAHFDNHDVFAVQTEGEKLWKIYSTQLELPVDLPPDTAETRQLLEKSRGHVVQEIRMRPGDILYLPRGRFHEALATDGPSLHVTFSVTALYGRVLFPLLESAALQFPEFRAYFPGSDEDGGRRLTAHLNTLGNLLQSLITSRGFFDEVAMSQQRLVPKLEPFNLPVQRSQTFFQVTDKAFPKASSGVALAYEWCASQKHFSVEKLIASFDFIAERDLRLAIDHAVAAGALVSVG
jgi:lysine-specific demethylase/histidyl-hydroxylase NO66